MGQIKVQKSVTITGRIKKNRPGASAFPFYKCEPGDSFLVPIEKQRKLWTAVQHRRRHHGEHYITRRTEDGKHVRCWRVDGLEGWEGDE